MLLQFADYLARYMITKQLFLGIFGLDIANRNTTINEHMWVPWVLIVIFASLSTIKTKK